MLLTIRRTFGALILLCAVATATHAQDAADPGAVDLATLRSEQQAQRTQIESAQGRYADLSQKQRKALLARQAELLALIDGKQSFAELTPAQQAEAKSALQVLATTGQDSGSERQVCRRERAIGSHRTSMVCRSEAQSQAQEAEATRQVEANRMQRQL